jgi:hypothetical protein
MVPAPANTSPPLTVHFTLAAPPEPEAENCSKAAPVDELLPLQPVQLVSMVAVPGETLNVALDEPPAADPPPQPASAIAAGAIAASSNRSAGQGLHAFLRLLASGRAIPVDSGPVDTGVVEVKTRL